MFGQCGDHSGTSVCPAVGWQQQTPVGVGEAWFFGILLALQQEQVQGRSVLAGQGVLCTTAEEALLP